MDRRKAETPPGDFDLHLPTAGAGSVLAALIVAVLCAVGLAIVASPARATAAVHASIVVDASTGRVLEAHNAGVRTYPASLTKLMTLYLVFSALEHGKLKLGQRLAVSAHAAAQSPTKLGLKPGTTITVRSAILGIVTRSANDAAVVLAEALGANETNFARLMNAEARKLGMTRTRFRNASGLPNPAQKTTAHDLAKLAIALIHRFPQYYDYFSVRSFEFHGKRIEGHDHLLASYEGCDGLKTGFIRASGYNLVSSAVRDGHRMVGVVLGGKTSVARDRRMKHLLDVAFARVRGARATRVARRAAQSEEVARRSVREERRQVETARESEEVVRHPAEEEKARVETRREAQEVARAPRDCSILIGGTYKSARHARRVVRKAIRTAPRELHGAHFDLVRAEQDGRRGYVIRVDDLSKWRASRACRKLRGSRFDCEVHEPSTEVPFTASVAD